MLKKHSFDALHPKVCTKLWGVFVSKYKVQVKLNVINAYLNGM
ncbi:hypothetical protein AKFMO35_02250 [Apilactobacillus kunkeei]